MSSVWPIRIEPSHRLAAARLRARRRAVIARRSNVRKGYQLAHQAAKLIVFNYDDTTSTTSVSKCRTVEKSSLHQPEAQARDQTIVPRSRFGLVWEVVVSFLP